MSNKPFYWLDSYANRMAIEYHDEICHALTDFISKASNRKNFSLAEDAKEEVIARMVEARDALEYYLLDNWH